MRCSNCAYTAEAEFRFCPECGAQQVAAAEDPLLGRILSDRYRILEKLGEGSMGAVYLAEHTAIKRRVAIKVLHRDLHVDEETLHRFQREGVAAGQIEHPCALQIFDLGREADGTLFLAMEYVEGQNLDQFLQESGPLDSGTAVDLLAQLLDALATAHAAGVVHRDLKPANLIVSTDSEGGHHLKVLDFGLSKLVDQAGDASLMTRSGRMLGTPMYMAPEQWSGATVDHRADLYAAGLLLYEMLSGRRPFAGSDLSQLFVKATQEPAPSLLEIADSTAVAADLEDWLQTALQKRPDDRFQTAGDMLDALEGARLDRLVSPKRARPRTDLGERSGSDGPATASPRRSSSRKPAIRSAASRRHGSSRGSRDAAANRDSRTLWIGGAAAVLLLGGGAYALFGGGGSDRGAQAGPGQPTASAAAAGFPGASTATLVRDLAEDSRSAGQTRYLTLLDDAWIALRTGDSQTARAKASTALALDAADAEGYLLRALTYRADGDDDTARADLRDALAAHPGYTAAHAELGWLEFDAGDSAAAAAAFTAVLDTAPEDADALAGRAALRCAENDAPGALELLDRAVDSAPRNARVHLWRGRALRLGGDPQGAVEAFVEAKRHAPRDVEPLLELAAVYRELDDTSSAERQFRAALDLDAQSLPAHRGLAELLLDGGRSSEAYALLAPQRGMLVQGDDLLLLGLAAHAEGSDDTDRILTAALESGVDRAGAVHRLLALRALDRDDWTLARKHADEAVQLDDRDAPALVALGVAMFRQQSYADAAETLQRAVDVDRSDAFALRTLGVLYMDYLDRPADALPLLQAARAAGDDHPELDRWITRLGG